MKITMEFVDNHEDATFVENLEEAVIKSFPALQKYSKKNQAAIDANVDKIAKQLDKWLKCGEYVEIEFDLDAMTATVKERK